MDGFIPTNTMSNTAFDVLRMDGIDDPLINVNKLGTLDLDESYFATAVSFIKEANNDLMESKQNLYKSISEATTQFVVLESFSDFFSKVNDIINKFIKFIKSLTQRFLTHINKLINSDKYINSHKKDFKDFRDTDKFTINGYNYTFNPNIPMAAASVSFNRSLFEDLYDKSGSIDLSPNGVNTSINKIDIEGSCDEFRGSVLGQSTPISVGEFDTELFKIYRDNSIDTEEIEVDSLEVSKALNRFTSFSDNKKQITNDQSKIERDYEQVKKQVKDITRRNGDLNLSAVIDRLPQEMRGNIKKSKDSTDNQQGFSMSADLMYKLDLYTKAKVDQITEFSNIHTLAFSAKLDALKESYKQDRALLYTALLKIQRTDNARKEL